MNISTEMIERFMDRATRECGDEVALVVNDLGFEGYQVSIVSADDHDEVVTMESDWDCNMEAVSTTIAGAIAKLEALCFEDLSATGGDIE